MGGGDPVNVQQLFSYWAANSLQKSNIIEMPKAKTSWESGRKWHTQSRVHLPSDRKRDGWEPFRQTRSSAPPPAPAAKEEPLAGRRAGSGSPAIPFLL